jgi:hypothetical protein
MSIRCKFKLDSITKSVSSGVEVASIAMTPVTSGSEENKAFWKWTPSGQLVVATVNAEAVAGLKLGGEYYLDITPAAP